MIADHGAIRRQQPSHDPAVTVSGVSSVTRDTLTPRAASSIFSRYSQSIAWGSE